MKNILVLSALLSILPVQAMAQSQTVPATTVAPPVAATAADQVVAEEEDDQNVLAVQRSANKAPVPPAVAATPLLTTPVLIGIGVAVAVAIGVASSGSSSSSHAATNH